MKAKAKEYELVIDYCAFMVAIVIARHVVTLGNIREQWSAEQLAASLNVLQYSETPNLRVHCVALKHGLQIFTRGISKRGLTTVLMLHVDKGPLEYFTLAASGRSTEIIFTSLHNPTTDESHDSVMSRVAIIRDELMLRSNYGISSHHTASSVFAALYLPLISEIETAQIAEQNEIETPNCKLITRKSPSKLSRRATQNSADKIIANTEKLFGKKHADFYLESALKKSKKGKMKQNENENEDIEINSDSSSSDEEDDSIGLHNDFMDDMRVLDALSVIPDKYVIFSEEDQEKVLSLYGIIREVAKERDHKHANKLAAKVTIKILQNSKYYSQITRRTINRWYDLKDSESQRAGRKVDEVFESEVWGNLMLCVFNKKVIMILFVSVYSGL